MLRVRFAFLGLLFSSALGCNQEDPYDSGHAYVQLSQIPASVFCFRILVQQGARTIDRRFDVAPGQASSFDLRQLPLGAVTFTGQAFPAACSGIDTQPPTWVSDPTSAILSAGQLTAVSLLMRQNGGASVCVSFEDVDGGSCTPTDGGGLTPAPLNCLGVGNCVLDCVTGAGGDLNSCFNTCKSSAKSGSANLWASAFICGQDYCTAPADAMAKCVTVVDPTTGNTALCDPGTTYAQCTDGSFKSTSCEPCINNARNPVLGDFSKDPPGAPTGMCPDPTSPDCKGGAQCTSKFNSCLMDL